MQLAFIFVVALAIFDRYGWIYCHSIDLCLISWPTYHTYKKKKKKKKKIFFDISLCQWMFCKPHTNITLTLLGYLHVTFTIYYAFVTNRPSLHRSLDDLWETCHAYEFSFFYLDISLFCKPPTNNGDFSVSDGPCPTNASFSGHTPGAGTHWGRLSKPRLVPRLQVVATNKLPPPVHILKVPCYVIRRFWRTSLKKKSAICWDMYQELCFIEVVRTSLCLWNDS